MSEQDATGKDVGTSDDLIVAHAELILRTRQVARDITERVQKVMDDTKAETPALPSDETPTAENPPL